MVWPFSHFRKPRQAPTGTIEAIYGMIVTQAREPIFYRDLGVPDTVNGRFDLLLLHLWLVLRRMRSVDGGAERSQALFDRFCEDMDDNLREMGVGDQTVPKRMREFGEAFYGRVRAYDQAIDGGGDALAAAICKNVLNGADMAPARELAAYVRASEVALAAAAASELLSGSFGFPSAIREDVTS